MPLHNDLTKLKSVVQFINPATQQFEDIDMGESKPYLILMQDVDNDNDDTYKEGRWISVRGRDSAFSYLESEAFGIDIVHSYVLSGNIHLGEEVSVYSFMRLCIEKNKVRTNLTVDDLDDYALTINPDMDLNLVYNAEVNKSISK